MDESTTTVDDFELIESLNERELEILAMFAEQRTNQEIADTLILSLNTVKWYARQIYGKLGVANRREAVERAGQLGLLGEPEQVAASLPHNLPAQLTPFVGRQTELSELSRLLPDLGCRLLTITGPGGMGKTRLALQIASLLAQASLTPFSDGVFMAPLADLDDEASVVTAVADAVGFRFYQADNTPEQQLGQFLRRKQMLLVLDNFEHLTDDETVRFVANLLTVASGLTVLSTSRVRLNIQGEQAFPLHGLDLPEATEGEGTETTEIGSLQLFTEAAQRANPTFALNPNNHSSVVAICRLVEGMPLAIELAASWTAVLEPSEILTEIRTGLDFLASDAVNVPVRQRSLPVVLDASWQLLGFVEREGVRKLSVFRGGFTREAARQVAEVTPRTLLGLVGKSWLQRDAEGRYRLLELLRQYGAEKLSEDESQEIAVRTRHSRYYCQWLSGPEVDLRGSDQQTKLDIIAVELENVHFACFWAANHGLLAHLDRAIETLGLYYRWQGGFVTGDHTFARLAYDLAGVTDETDQHTLAQILVWHCAFRGLMGDRKESQRLANETLALLDSPMLEKRDTRAIQAHIELQLGYGALVGKARKGEPHFTLCYELYEQIDDKIGMAYALIGLGRTERNLYRFDKAEALFRQGIRLHEQFGNQLGYSDALTSLGGLAGWQTRFDEAERLLRQSMSVTPPSDTDAIAHTLYWLSRTFHSSGRFAQAATAMDECLSLRRDRGMQIFVILTGVRCGMIYRDMGAIEMARKMGEEGLVESQAINYEPGSGQSLALLGSIDLLEGYTQLAFERLQDGVAAQLATTDAPGNMSHQAWLGLAALTLGQRDEAWRHILAELNWALHSQIYLGLLTAVAGLALLLVNDGDTEQAVELHALLLEHAYTTNAHWFSKIVTPDVMAAAAVLDTEQRSAAEERGRTGDLWEVAAKLVESKG